MESLFDEEFTTYAKYRALIDRGAPFLPDKKVYVYQKEAIGWMSEREAEEIRGVKGGVLSLDPGLGKTLVYLTHTLLAPKKTSTLVVVPKSLIGETVTTIKKFFGERVRFVVFYPSHENHGSEDPLTITSEGLKEIDFVITTYETLLKYSENYLDSINIYNGDKIMSYKLPSRRNLPRKGYSILYGTHWDRIISEESHKYLTNPNTLTFRSFMALSAEFRWAVTGSFINNRSSDFWSMIHCLGYTFIDSAKKWNKLGSQFFSIQNLGSLLHYKTYEDCGVKMPELQITKKYFEFPADTAAEYNTIIKNAQTTIKKFEQKTSDYSNVLAAFTRIRIFCSKSKQKYRALTKVAQGKKCIVFSSFVKTLEDLRDYLGEDQVVMFSSETKNREETIEEFRSGDKQFLLSTYQVGGVGLNLQFINSCVFMEPYWNEATMKQALHRCWRVGQSDSVQIYEFCIKNSIEENIYKMCTQKADISKKLLDGKVEDAVSKLGVQSIKTLLS